MRDRDKEHKCIVFPNFLGFFSFVWSYTQLKKFFSVEIGFAIFFPS